MVLKLILATDAKMRFRRDELGTQKANPMDRITQILESAGAGNPQAASQFVSILYRELRQLAGVFMAKLPPGQTLQPTALVHEAYMRMVGKEDPGWDGRAHFFSVATRAMREILVEEARRKAALKRGGDRNKVKLEDGISGEKPLREDWLALEQALQRLERDDPRKGQIVNLRFFGGFNTREVAKALGVSEATVKREWRYIRAWLHKELDHEDPEDR